MSELVNRSILKTDQRVKVDKIVFLQGFDKNYPYKRITIQKPDSTIYSSMHIGAILTATLDATVKKAEALDKLFKKIKDTLDSITDENRRCE